jgi:hypothetical protein
MSIIANISRNSNDYLDEDNTYLIIYIFLLNFVYYIMYY